jgi:hypothetical protein
MKRYKIIGLALGLVPSLLCAGLVTAATLANDAASQQQPAVATPTVVSEAVPLSPPAREVVKMAVSGVPDGVIQAYINNSASTFNLTPDAIIHLQGIGVSSATTAAMLTHDTQLRNNAAVAQTPPPDVPATAPQESPTAPAVQQPDYTDSTQAPPSDPGYSGLAPYGYWNYVGGSGWCWQPYSWVWQYPYPWGLGCFSRGCWWYRNNCGWCWSPNARFRGFNTGFNRGFNAGFTHSAVFFGASSRGFNGGFTASRSFGSSQPFIIHNSASFGQRSFGASSFNRGFSGGGSSFGVRSGGGNGGFSGGFSRGGFGGMGGGFHR